VSAAKNFLIGTVVLFGGIGAFAWVKNGKVQMRGKRAEIVEIPIQPALPAEPLKPVLAPIRPIEKIPVKPPSQALSDEDCPLVDEVHRLFALDSSKLSIVETVSFTSRVPWLKDRPAWVADYASHYETSRHFIARSLNRKIDYFTQKVSPGDRFNVFRKDKNIQFHLLIDLSRCRMLFYYLDLDLGERFLLKTYRIGIGRQDSSRASGYLTPMGKYSLGEKVAIYKPETTGFFGSQKIEMIRVFGTRWIPFHVELEGCSEEAKGFGLHGAPWINDPVSGLLIEDRSKLGKYDSDGCIRLASEDIE